MFQRLLPVTELIVSGTQCTCADLFYLIPPDLILVVSRIHLADFVHGYSHQT